MKTLKNLLLSLFVIASIGSMAQAPTEIHMMNGTKKINQNTTYYFYDSGGEDLTESQDPTGDNNWITWYQHGESFLLHLNNTSSGTLGIKLKFNYLRINDDHLLIYEGDAEDPNKLIVDLTNNDYDKNENFANFTIMSHGNMTIRFTSNSQYRDQGWDAEIELAAYAPQPPYAVMGICDSKISLLPGSKAASGTTTIKYTTDGSDPETNGSVYNTAFSVTPGTTVKAVLYEGNTVSAMMTKQFTSMIAPPDAPEISFDENTNKVTIKAVNKPQNDTYWVRYTLNGDDPEDATAANYTEVKDETTFDITAPCTIKAQVRGTTCPTIFSEQIASKTITSIKVLTPTITFDYDNNKASIACSFSVNSPNSVVIKYTTDGSDPKTSPTCTTYTASFNVTIGTTVKAYAYVTGTDAANYEESSVATEIYVPASGSSVSGDIVLLDDREPHNWSYYSDGTQPVHSLNPADVKITYFGNGTNTVSTSNANSNNLVSSDFTASTYVNNNPTVQVSATETEHTFIYLKTLERENVDGTGNCPYTVIPNPFSKRPTYGSGDTRWRGFYGWRVKAVRGGSIQGYGQNTIIPAETEVMFVPDNTKGMEVELEAVWARAYVFTSINNLNSAGNNAYVADANGEHRAYERNFVVVTANVNNTANNKPATITCLNPDGSGTIATRTGGMFTCAADTKFEYINLNNNNGTITAANHYLCFGRGISTNQSAANLVQGISEAINGGLNYTIRMESGRYNKLSFVTTGGANQGGRVQVKAIMGCDYDRAKGTNNLLSVSRNNNLFYAQNVRFNSLDNKDVKTFDCVVKSGQYQAEVNNDGGYEHCFYCGHNYTGSNANGEHYPGIRYVIVEGGEFASMNGGKGVNNDITNNNGHQATPDNDTYVLRIKNGSFRGSVFGAAANTESQGSRRIVITGGTIQGWVAGGANGTNTTWDASKTTGNARIYVGGNTIVGGSNPNTVNGTEGGNVFGAGRGNNQQAASIVNSYVVIADNADILHNVYGGGNYGYITTESNVYILGGTIGDDVFGGAYGNAGNATHNYSIPQSNVYIKGGAISGSVYGGSNSSGNVGNVTMEITGGEIKGSVFGGGLGQTTNVTGDVTLTVGKAKSTDTATISGDVYGGSEMGKVNTNTDNNTTVTINQAKIAGNVFGGGFGSKTNPVAEADVNGNITVTINGGTMNNVFGCNNINGTPKGDVEVHFNGGKAVNVYGGGNFAHYLTTGKNPVVYLTGGEVTNNVYGGGSLAKVNKTVVNVTGGQAYNVFAGAEGNHKDSTLVLGNKTVNMQGGTVGNIYGGSFTCKDVAKSFVNISGGHVQSHVFGSGYFGDMYGDCYVYIGKNAIEKAPHHAENLDLLSKYGTQLDNLTQLWIENNVYAGANWGSYTGTFGAATIKKQGNDGGHSNIYIDGTGYNITSGKNSNYILIDGSVYGSGTSCDAGVEENNVIIRNYGYMDEVDEVNTILRMTRNLRSIQRVKDLVLDNSSINFVGQGNIASNDPTVEYGIYHITNIVRATNNSNISLSKPLEQVHKLGSYTCDDVYDANETYNVVPYDADRNVKSGVVINEGGYLMVCEEVNNTKVYGELEGFFNMQEPNSDGINNEGYIFARPKYIAGEGNRGIYNNPATYDINKGDGGFVDFAINPTRNVFDINGNNAPAQPQPQGYMQKAWNGTPVQMAYTNKTTEPKLVNNVPAVNPNDYRFWRYKPIDTPTSSREIMFIVKADEVADADAFLTTTGSVYLPPAIGTNAVYKITELHWGVDGKDCYAVNSAITEENGDNYIQADGNKFIPTEDENKDAADYYANPNSSFGFVMDFSDEDGSLVKAYGEDEGYDKMVLSNESFNGYFINHQMAQLNTNSTELPKLDFVLTYSNRLSQNEMWAEALAVIDEYDPADTTTAVQKIYLYLSVSTMTRIGQNVETSVYASTAYSGTAAEYNVNAKDSLYTYKASLTLPTFMLGNKGLYATFTPSSTNETNFNKKIENEVTVPIVSGVGLDEWYEVKGTKNMALRFYATDNGDNTNGWTHKGKGTGDPNNVAIWDFENIDNRDTATDMIGAADGRTYTTINFELRYDPKALSEIHDLQIGQHYLGYVTLNLAVDNAQGAQGEVNAFAIKVHVYVTGASKFFYLDGVNGRDGYSGMFPDQAKKTFFGVLNANGYTVNDPIFVVDKITAEEHSNLTWDANKFLNTVTVSEEEAENYTEEEIRQLSQVKVYRYPGGHYLSDGTTGDPTTNVMYQGMILDIMEDANFIMRNVRISGGSDLNDNSEYNPNRLDEQGVVVGNDLKSKYPLITIAARAKVTINNSSLVYNNNTSTDAKAGAIYNEGLLTVDGIHISDNTSAVENGKGAGIYQADSMILGNTQMITIEDQIYLDDKKMMTAPNGYLADGSELSDILVYYEKPIDSKYSGRVIVRYPNHTPSAPEAPFWKTLPPKPESSILKNHKAAEDEENYESNKYELNSTLSGFQLANGGDNNALAYISDDMNADYDPITNHDIIMIIPNAFLPIELLYFTAECMGEATQLQWSTASETNNEYFTIERSSDAVNYEEVARVQGAGTSSQRNDYSLMVDNNANGITYYRLRQTDIDGKYEIFAPIAIQCKDVKEATTISIYPVPAKDQVTVLSSNSPMTRVEIYSIMGNKVSEEQVEGHQATLQIGHLATGVYTAKIHTEDGQVINVRLIKK